MIERRNNTKNVVIIILAVLLLALAGYCSYLTFFKKEDNKTDCINTKKDDYKEEKNIQNKIDIYGIKSDSGAYYICNHKSDTDECKNVLFTINTDTANASIIHLSISNDNTFQYIIYYDDGVKLYNVKDESIKKIDIDVNGNIEWLEDGFIFNGDDEAYYFDLKLDKKTFDKYDEIYPIEDIHDSNYVNNLKYIYTKKGKSASIIDFKTGNVLNTIDISDYEGIGFIKDGSYIIASLYGVEDTTKIIYNTKGDKKVELKDNQVYEINGSKLTIYEESLKKVKEY